MMRRQLECHRVRIGRDRLAEKRSSCDLVIFRLEQFAQLVRDLRKDISLRFNLMLVNFGVKMCKIEGFANTTFEHLRAITQFDIYVNLVVKRKRLKLQKSKFGRDMLRAAVISEVDKTIRHASSRAR